MLFGGACSLEGSSGLVLVLEEDSPSLKAGVEPGPSSCDDLHYLSEKDLIISLYSYSGLLTLPMVIFELRNEPGNSNLATTGGAA